MGLLKVCLVGSGAVTKCCVGSIVAAMVLGSPASAQPAYGSYVGGGLTIGSQGSGGAGIGGVIAARYKLLEAPISLRGQLLVDGNSVALVPTVSYDFPLTWQAEPYIGAGFSLTSKDSNVGDRSAFVIQPGIDYAVPNTKLVVFGNALVAFNAYKGGSRSGGTAVSVQTGVGWRF